MRTHGHSDWKIIFADEYLSDMLIRCYSCCRVYRWRGGEVCERRENEEYKEELGKRKASMINVTSDLFNVLYCIVLEYTKHIRQLDVITIIAFCACKVKGLLMTEEKNKSPFNK